MQNFDQSNHSDAKQNLQVWVCDHCQSVHFKAGNVLLNFSKNEFAELTQSILEIFQREYGSLEFYNLVMMLQQNDDILLSQSIA